MGDAKNNLETELNKSLLFAKQKEEENWILTLNGLLKYWMARDRPSRPNPLFWIHPQFTDEKLK